MASLWLLDRYSSVTKDKQKQILPIYIGDDLTDEDAFQILKNKGLTIFVGKPKATKARFYLKDTEEVAKFLSVIIEILSKNTK